MKMKNIFISIFIGFWIGISLSACGNQNEKPLEIGDEELQTEVSSDEIVVTQNQFELAKMKIGKLGNHNFSTSVRATGMVDIPSKNKISVSSYAGGYVTSINLIPGQFVRKGQVLFLLENPEFVQMQQDYLEANEQLKYLKSDYERQKTLSSENIASQKNFLKAESEYKVTLAKMEGIKKRLSLIKIDAEKVNPQNLFSSISIYAPTNGYVSEVTARKGMYLNPTDVAVNLLNTDDLHIELNVFEKDILSIKVGQDILVKIPDGNTSLIEAKVHLIGKTVDEEKRIVGVIGHFKNKQEKEKLIAGMYIDAEIITSSNTANGLSELAIVSEEGLDYVLIHTGGSNDLKTFEKKAVKLGQRKNGFVEILNIDDFSRAENILIEGAFNLIGIE
jgi:cobalt-zinc-cadmium efflux system membrane fusion protein